MVQVYALNYDFYFEMNEGHRDPNERPFLNRQGEQYVVIWEDGDFFASRELPSNGFMTLNEAKLYAATVVNQIDWSEPFTSDHI